jgi:hypothetical protein
MSAVQAAAAEIAAINVDDTITPIVQIDADWSEVVEGMEAAAARHEYLTQAINRHDELEAADAIAGALLSGDEVLEAAPTKDRMRDEQVALVAGLRGLRQRKADFEGRRRLAEHERLAPVGRAMERCATELREEALAAMVRLADIAATASALAHIGKSGSASRLVEDIATMRQAMTATHGTLAMPDGTIDAEYRPLIDAARDFAAATPARPPERRDAGRIHARMDCRPGPFRTTTL